MRKSFLFLVMILVVTSTLAAQDQWVPGEVLVRMSPDSLVLTDHQRYDITDSAQKLLASAGVESWEPVSRAPVKRGADIERWMCLTCRPGVSETALLETVQALPNIESAHLNYYVYLDEMPNDPDYDKQYAWELLNAEEAWDVTHGSASVIVAIIDSGTDMDHEDLVANIWTNSGEVPNNGLDDDGNGYIDDDRGWDFAGDDNNPDNVNVDNDHGTHVAGIVSAVSNNGIGVAGGSWNCPIMILKVFPNNGGGATVGNVAEAMHYGADNGALVENLSLGNNQYTQIEADAVWYAYTAGLAVVCAAGNGGNDGIGDSTPHYPSACDGAIGVGSINKFEEKDGSSNYGEDYVDIFAPGVAIRSTLPNNEYRNLSGTSMASPVAAGLAALIMSNNPGISPDDVLMRMQKGCEPINDSNPVYRDQLDPGRINYYYSVAETPVIRVVDCIVDDSAGNGNHEADQGETVNLELHLQNKSWMDGNNIQVTLAAGSGISVVDGSAQYGALASGETGVNMDALTLTVTGATHQMVDITMNVVADGGYNEMVNFQLSINDPIPPMPGFPVVSWGGFNASPRVADLDNNGDLEIITASNDGTIAVFNHDGTYFPGWPVNLMSTQYIDSILILAPPAIADLDMDGDLEIIVADQFADAEWRNPNDPGVGQKQRIQGRIHVFNHDGTNFGGNWPFVTQLEFANQPDDPPQAGFKSGPAVADIAGDEYPEIVIGNYGDHVFVFDYMGNIVSGWPRNVGTDVFATAATYDFDEDGKCEVVIADKDDTDPLDSGALHLFDGDGTEMPGFPVAWDNQIYSVPVLADMDGDEIPEIIFGWGDYENTVDSKGLMVMDMRSEPLPGWPVSLPDTVYASPGLGDLDGDGDLEIVVCSVAADVYAFHHDGSPVTGFPVNISADPDAVVNSSPTIADVTNDGLPEILFCMEIGFNEAASMHILHSDGSPMTGTPIELVDNGFSSPCIADIDNDGDLEILVTDKSTSVFNLTAGYDPEYLFWPTYHGNNHSTGLYAGETPVLSGINLMITDPMFTGGEEFVLDAVLANGDSTYTDVDLYVILDVYSMFWFYPSWSETADWEDIPSLPPGHMLKNVFTFTWPSGVSGTAENLYFWGGLLTSQLELLGHIDYVTFGYTE